MNNKTVMLAAVAAFGLLATGCAGVGQPSGWASPTIDRSLYVTLERGRLSSLDPVEYQVEWQFPASDEFSCGGGPQQRWALEGIYEAPALDEDTLYIGAYDGAVYAVDREQAVCRWRFHTGDPIVGGVVLTGDGLYVPSGDGFLYLLDPQDGGELARRQVGVTWATPLVLPDAVYVATMDGKLWKLEPGTLEPLWDSPFSSSAALLMPPTLSPTGGVLVGGIGKTLYLVSEDDGSEVWSVDGANWFWGRPAVDGNVIYATNLGNEVKAINAEDGSELWTFQTETAVRAGVVVAGDVVVAVDDQGNVFRLAREDGSLQGQPSRLEQTVHATPLLLGETPAANGTPTVTPIEAAEAEVLISTRDGNLWVLNVSRGTVTEVAN